MWETVGGLSCRCAGSGSAPPDWPEPVRGGGAGGAGVGEGAGAGVLSQDLVNLVDTDGTGNISFPEFLKIMEIKSEAENFEVQICILHLD